MKSDKERAENMDRNLIDAYMSKGKIMTSRDSFPLGNQARLLGYIEARNQHAVRCGLPALTADDYRRMATEEIDRRAFIVANSQYEHIVPMQRVPHDMRKSYRS